MTALIAFLAAHGVLIAGIVYAVLNLLVALFNKNEKVVGILGVIRTVIEHLVALQPKNSEGTVKLPGKAPAPTKPTPIL